MSMYLGDTHADSRMDVEWLMREFASELREIIALHRYVVTTATREFETVYERLLAEHTGGEDDYNGGDAICDAEEELGVNPWNVEQHLGLMTLARAVSLAEIVMARLAAVCWTRPELTVFPNGRTWQRAWEHEFYKTCLEVKFDPDDDGFGPLRQLRDASIHGYGVPVIADQQHKLAARLHEHFDPSVVTAEEIELGYEGTASFFGEDATFDRREGLRSTLLMGLPAANLTPVATYRALVRIGAHVDGAAKAVLSGPRHDVGASKFVKMVEKWWTERGGIPDK